MIFKDESPSSESSVAIVVHISIAGMAIVCIGLVNKFFNILKSIFVKNLPKHLKLY